VTPDEQLELYNRKADHAFAGCLRDLKKRKPEILGELRALVQEGALGDQDARSEMDYHKLHRAELEHFGAAVAARLAKYSRGWPG
jgi:hypothetical protein